METKSENLEERIHKQLKEQFHNAFNDIVREAIDNNDHEYIAKLYKEIRDRLAAMVKPQGKTWNRIHEQLDVSFFEQLLEHKQFTATSLPGLVNTTFDWIGRLQAPVRDSDSAAAKQRVLDSGNSSFWYWHPPGTNLWICPEFRLSDSLELVWACICNCTS